MIQTLSTVMLLFKVPADFSMGAASRYLYPNSAIAANGTTHVLYNL